MLKKQTSKRNSHIEPGYLQLEIIANMQCNFECTDIFHSSFPHYFVLHIPKTFVIYTSESSLTISLLKYKYISSSIYNYISTNKLCTVI